MKAPIVSVVIPTRDRLDRVGTAVRSALAQRDVDLEIVLVDDASTDGTSATIAELGEPRIRIVRNAASLGESATRNRGITEASGPWIAFLDDDDLWSPHKLSRQLEALELSRSDWAYAGDVAVDDDLRLLYGEPPPPPEEVARTLGRYNSVPSGASNVIVRSSLLARVGPFDPSLQRTGDWDMWLRLLSTGPPASVPEPLVANRVHRGNVSRDMRVLFRELPVIAARHGIDVDRARHLRWAAWSASVDGRRRDAVRYYARAVAAGDLMSIGRAGIALVWPRDRLAASRATGADTEWLDRARAWIQPFTDRVDR